MCCVCLTYDVFVSVFVCVRIAYFQCLHACVVCVCMSVFLPACSCVQSTARYGKNTAAIISLKSAVRALLAKSVQDKAVYRAAIVSSLRLGAR